jgi:hypothetical protein
VQLAAIFDKMDAHRQGCLVRLRQNPVRLWYLDFMAVFHQLLLLQARRVKRAAPCFGAAKTLGKPPLTATKLL